MSKPSKPAPKIPAKHAYLILAHKNDLTFKTLIKMLDHPDNDIYIHMDLKNSTYKTQTTQKIAPRSHIYHVTRTKTTWGSYSLVNAELSLLKAATKNHHYTYYHLLSGGDLPIKTQTKIHNFFNQNYGKEFIKFQSPIFQYQNRIRYYYPFQEKTGKAHNIFIKLLNKSTLEIQKTLHINRNQNQKFQKGTNWFSITDNLARYIIDHEAWIQKTFKHTFCCDEIFLQTLVDNSDFKNNLYRKKYDNNPLAAMRLIDWHRGTPYTFKISDFDEIKHSKCLFARKFDSKSDQRIIKKIQESFC